MMAGAPGASGSLVIFDSSGDTGWNPPPAFTIAGWYAAIPRSITIANQQRAKRRPIDIAERTFRDFHAKQTRSVCGGREQRTAPDDVARYICVANPRPGTRQYSGMVTVSRESPIQPIQVLSYEGPVVLT